MDFVIHLLTTVLLGLAAGFGAGFIFNKITKLVLFIIVGIVLGMAIAVYAGYIDSSWFSVLEMPEFSLPNPTGFEVIVDLFLSHLPFGIAAVAGFFYGLGLRPK
jgi:uncharacterized membrane protein (Fun14 family)